MKLMYFFNKISLFYLKNINFIYNRLCCCILSGGLNFDQFILVTPTCNCVLLFGKQWRPNKIPYGAAFHQDK